jgi:hypothetical protein
MTCGSRCHPPEGAPQGIDASAPRQGTATPGRTTGELRSRLSTSARSRRAHRPRNWPMSHLTCSERAIATYAPPHLSTALRSGEEEQ